MKTISFNRSPSSMLSLIALIGGLTALYLYRRRGGTYRDLYSQISRYGNSARDYLRSKVPESTSSSTRHATAEGHVANV